MKKQVRDQLVEQIRDVQKVLYKIKMTAIAVELVSCITVLESMQNICKNEFSENRYNYYSQIFTGLILAMEQSKKENLDKTSLTEACDICIELLSLVITELLREKEVKKEILFLPYKASMWDSLESIWKAAVEDNSCDVYVVAVPYADRNPDGTASKWHCEANLFPSYVPVLDYHVYDIAVRKPDIVYIHNPYDEGNRVTSVDSKYYSYELKKHVKTLVYVPYFVTGEKPLDPHFCQESAVVFADYVIVESEIVKEQYERYYPGGNPPKGKILALGSPKFDKVLTSTKSEYNLPNQWKKLIKEKKVVLYNTSLQATLDHSEYVIEKLKYVFSIFKNRDDVVLWWRPHPLLESTIETMLPELISEYRDIKQLYIDEGWGIYDDTADLNRSICWSDAYYGDMSSVVYLYRKLKKPILLQSMSRQKKIKNNMLIELNIWPSDFCVDGDNIWFIHGKWNALMRYDLKLDYLELVRDIPGEELFLEKLYGNICIYKKKIYLVPSWGREFAVYDMEKKTLKKIQLRQIENYIGRILFCGTFQFGKYLYCIPCFYASLIRVDMENLTIEYLLDCKNTAKQYEINSYIDSVTRISDELIVGLWVKTNKIFIYNMRINKLIVKSIFCKEMSQYTRVANIDNMLFLSDGENSLIRYSLSEYEIIGDKIDIPYDLFIIYAAGDDTIIIEDLNGEGKALMNKNGDIIYHVSREKKLHNNEFDFSSYYGIYKEEKGLKYYFDRNEYILYRFSDWMKEKKDKIKIQLNDLETLEKYQKNIYNTRAVLLEIIFPIEKFIQLIKKTNNICLLNHSSLLGTKIHKNICNRGD